MFSNWIYILVADDQSGKTTFQKRLIFYLCGYEYDRLPSNVSHKIMWPKCAQGMPSVFMMGRSLQERDYQNPAHYFENHLKEEDPVCILSSHATGCENDVQGMIHEARKRLYNVGGVFFENNYDVVGHEKLAFLDWDERLWIANPAVDDDAWQYQIENEAKKFAEFLMARAQVN